MASSLAKWGNSLALRIPSGFVKEMNLEEGTEVEISIVDGTLVLKPMKHKHYSLEDLVESITPENRHAEIWSEPAVGNEIW